MVSTVRRPNRRRRWFIAPTLQLRFVRVILLIIIAIALLVLTSIYLTLWVTLTTFELWDDPVTVALFKSVALCITIEMLVMAPLLLWGFTWLGIRMAHRFAGPLIRVMSAIDQMKRGDFDIQITLRKDDGLTDLAEDINQLALTIRDRLKT